MRLLRALVASTALLVWAPAYAANDVGDLICETTTTTGTGTVNLAGAVSNYVTFVSQITSGSTVPYHITASDGKMEVGTGTFTDATPDTLSRTANWSTDGSGAELTLPAGTHTVCLGPISTPFLADDVTAVDDVTAGDDLIAGDDLTADVLELDLGTSNTLDCTSGSCTIEGVALEKAGTQMIYIPAASMISRATSGADCSVTFDSGAADNTIRVCGFDTAADEWAFFTISMPPRWNEGTITAQYVWTNTTAASAAETVSIDISCASIGDTEGLNTALGTPINVDDTNDTDLDAHLSAVSSAVTCSNTPAANDTVMFGVMRDVSDDNLAGDMNLIGVRLFITTDTANDG